MRKWIFRLQKGFSSSCHPEEKDGIFQTYTGINNSAVGRQLMHLQVDHCSKIEPLQNRYACFHGNLKLRTIIFEVTNKTNYKLKIWTNKPGYCCGKGSR